MLVNTLVLIFVFVGSSAYRMPTTSTCGGTIDRFPYRIKYPAYGRYRNYEWCRWTIEADRPVFFNFTHFDTERGRDWVSINGEDSSQGNFSRVFSGSRWPFQEGPVDGVVYLKFTSDYSDTRDGFAVNIIYDESYTTPAPVTEVPATEEPAKTSSPSTSAPSFGRKIVQVFKDIVTLNIFQQ